MRLLCVIDSLGSGGAQRQLVNVACALKAMGHSVEFFTYYPGDHFKSPLDREGIPVHFDCKTSQWSVTPVLALRRLIREGGFGAVLAYLETPAVYAELACLGLPNVRVVVSERNTVSGGKVAMRGRLLSQAHRLADAVVANSDTHRDWMAFAFPFLKERLRTIWNGTDTSEFHPPPFRAATSIIRLLGVARITPTKNLIRMAVALGRSVEQGLLVTLDWAGRVEDDAYYHQVLRAITEAGVAKIWRWLGERNDIPELMRQYDALILPSLCEGLPNVVCEALASGLPVLAGRVSDAPRLVQNGVTGFLFDPKDPREMATVIALFADLPAEARSEMGIAARAFAERQLSIQKCADAYEAVLRWERPAGSGLRRCLRRSDLLGNTNS